jgi:hypothetical protein
VSIVREYASYRYSWPGSTCGGYHGLLHVDHHIMHAMHGQYVQIRAVCVQDLMHAQRSASYREVLRVDRPLLMIV